MYLNRCCWLCRRRVRRKRSRWIFYCWAHHIYSYDAAGTKWKKTITDSLARHSTTILYIDGFVYQQNDSITNADGGVDTLQFMAHEEGRARWAFQKFTTGTTAYSFQYDFFEKDHLGNTRMVLTQERDTTNYLASMEYQYRTTEAQLFGNITNTCVAWNSMPNYQNIPNNIRFAFTSPNDSVSKVDYTGTSGQTTGPSLLLKVMSGDSLKIGVQCFYNTGTGSTNNSSFSSVLNSLANGLVSIAGTTHGSLSNLTASNSSVYTGVTSFLGTDESAPSGYPKAYLNWIFLDDQFNYVSSLSGSVATASATYPAGSMNMIAPGSQIALNKSGYLYIWVSNETQGWDVFFDNLSVQYKQGPVLEENHYYPFGLTMAGISDKAIKTQYAQNKYRFNFGSELQNQEFSDGSGLETYDATFRMYDPQIGRFWQVDPLGELAEGWSPYAFVLDNPISLVDPLGDTATLPAVTVTPPPDPKRDNNLPGRALIGTPPGGVNVPSPPTNTPEIPINQPGTEPTGDPGPEAPPPPGIGPPAILTAVFTLIPITGNTDWPNGDELFYHKYPQFKPENLPRGVQNKPIDDIYLVRFGPGPESAEELGADAKKATYFGLPHGVSTAIRPKPPTFGRSARVLDVMKHFLVLKTGERPDHFTVVLPNPVTQQVAEEFNALFTTK